MKDRRWLNTCRRMAAENEIPPSSCANLKGLSVMKNMVRPVAATKMPAPIVTGVDQGRVFHVFTTGSRLRLVRAPLRTRVARK